MELWDLLDRDGVPTGRLIVRGSTLQAGQYHLVVHIWIMDETGYFLIQRRALDVDSDPGAWATTVGCVVAGESSRAAVVREVREELGLDISSADLVLLDRLENRNQLEDIWLVGVTATEVGRVSHGSEVMESRWVSRDELQGMVSREEFFRYSYIHELLAEPIPQSLSPPG